MSLPLARLQPVPRATARVAHQAFPHGNAYLSMRDGLGSLYRDADFQDLFPRDGQPALAPWRLALVCIMQFAEGLSDRQAADAVRARIDWKYALALELEDPGFNFSVLSEFRDRLLAGGAEGRLLDLMLTRFQERGWLKARGRQRTDSTHVLAAVRVVNRLESVVETLRAALNAVAAVTPEWLQRHVPVEWFERYGRRAEEHRLPKGQQAREDYAALIGADGFALLAAVDAPETPEAVRPLPAVGVLRAMWTHQYGPPPAGPGQTVRWRAAAELPTSHVNALTLPTTRKRTTAAREQRPGSATRSTSPSAAATRRRT